MQSLINELIIHRLAVNMTRCDVVVTEKLIEHLRKKQQSQIENQIIANKIKQEKIK